MYDDGCPLSSRCGVRHCPLTLSKLIAAVIAAVLLLIPLTAVAHTDEELDAWVIEAGELNIGTLATYDEYAARHPRYFGRPVPHTHTPRRATPAPVVGTSIEQWRSLVETYFRAADVERALRIMACESGGNPDAKNPRSSASGLFQHLGKYWASRSTAAGYAGASIFDPTANVAVAAWLRDQRGGFNHWVCQ